MDTPSKNGSYLVIAVCIVAVVALVLSIASFLGVSNLKKQFSQFSGRMDSIEASSQKAAKSADSAVNRVASVANDAQHAFDSISSEMADMRTSINRVTIDTKTLSDKLDSSGKSAPHHTAASSGSGSGGPSAPKIEPGTLSDDGTYVIKANDTFARLSAKFGVSVEAIQSANPGVDPRRLRIGQKIVIPVKAGAPSAAPSPAPAPNP